MFVPFVFIVGCWTSFTTLPWFNSGGDANVAAAVMISKEKQREVEVNM